MKKRLKQKYLTLPERIKSCWVKEYEFASSDPGLILVDRNPSNELFEQHYRAGSSLDQETDATYEEFQVVCIDGSNLGRN